MRRTRRWRLDPWIRLRIVQIRSSNPTQPPSLDRILDQLQAGGVNPLPSRGTVQNVVHWWENLPPEIKTRDRPFQWSRLESARIPWEASEWVMECKRLYEAGQILDLWQREGENALQMVQLWYSPLTNRWATWCWRVHLAAPDMEHIEVTSLAHIFVVAEQAHDLFDLGPLPAIERVEAWLSYRPDRGDGAQALYGMAADFGITPRIHMTRGDIANQADIVKQLYSLLPLGRSKQAKLTEAAQLGFRSFNITRRNLPLEELKAFIAEYDSSHRSDGNERPHPPTE